MIFPLRRSTQIAKRFLPSTGAVVSQICFPQTTGEDQPLPWMGVFQRMFCFSLQRVGRPVALAWPLPCGPRYSGQLSFAEGWAPTRAVASKSNAGCMRASFAEREVGGGMNAEPLKVRGAN